MHYTHLIIIRRSMLLLASILTIILPVLSQNTRLLTVFYGVMFAINFVTTVVTDAAGHKWLFGKFNTCIISFAMLFVSGICLLAIIQ